ncbi:MAG: tRNA lysidine(34) synthetase TilS, partial [Parafilimonas sp.]
MDLLQRFITHWKEHFSHLSSNNCHLFLAVSGGIDSIVLTDLIYKAKFNFTIAHCNFQLRGEESERDETFVKTLTEKYGNEILIKKFDTEKFAKENKLSIQEAARKLRYEWFSSVISQQPVAGSQLTVNCQLSTANFLATAHHADDNIETLLLNFFRGTAIKGLTGIPLLDKERKIIRPLLFA